MVINSLLAGSLARALASALALSFVPAVPATPSKTGPAGHLGPNDVRIAATVDSFSPPKKKKKRKLPTGKAAPGGAADDGVSDQGQGQGQGQGDEAAPPPPPKRQETSPARRRQATDDESEPGAGNEDSSRKPRRAPPRSRAQESDDDEDSSRNRRATARKHAAVEEEEEQEEEDTPSTIKGLPVLVPRLISLNVGIEVTGRSFKYNTPLQNENTLPRSGVLLAVETYPLAGMAPDWFSTLGIGASLAAELGAAAEKVGSTTVSSQVSQQRWSIDLRYAILAGQHFVLVPALGYGRNKFDLKNDMPIAPSVCNAQSTSPCLADIQTSFFVADLDLRVGILPTLSLSLRGGYLFGLSIGKGAGQIGQERDTIMSGFNVELASNLLLLDWLSARVSIPFTRFGYTFSGGNTAATYTSATETYYGLIVGAVVFTP